MKMIILIHLVGLLFLNCDTVSVNLNEGEVQADIITMAIGVRPESSLAKVAGLHVDECGHIIVNDRMQTSNSDIFAVGDAVIRRLYCEKCECIYHELPNCLVPYKRYSTDVIEIS